MLNEPQDVGEYTGVACPLMRADSGRPEQERITTPAEGTTVTDRGPSTGAGEEKSLAIMFTDIAGYTAFAEQLHACQVIHFLDGYFQRMGEIVKQHAGRIIDYYGDGLLAVFGLENEPGAADQSVQAGLAMLEAMQATNQYSFAAYQTSLTIRIGIHYGSVVVGSIGIEGMRKMAVIGDAVNFASRIEQINKELNTHFLVSQQLLEQLQTPPPLGPMHEVAIRGKNGLYKLYPVAP